MAVREWHAWHKIHIIKGKRLREALVAYYIWIRKGNPWMSSVSPKAEELELQWWGRDGMMQVQSHITVTMLVLSTSPTVCLLHLHGDTNFPWSLDKNLACINLAEHQLPPTHSQHCPKVAPRPLGETFPHGITASLMLPPLHLKATPYWWLCLFSYYKTPVNWFLGDIRFQKPKYMSLGSVYSYMCQIKPYFSFEVIAVWNA